MFIHDGENPGIGLIVRCIFSCQFSKLGLVLFSESLSSGDYCINIAHMHMLRLLDSVLYISLSELEVERLKYSI